MQKNQASLLNHYACTVVPGVRGEGNRKLALQTVNLKKNPPGIPEVSHGITNTKITGLVIEKKLVTQKKRCRRNGMGEA